MIHFGYFDANIHQAHQSPSNTPNALSLRLLPCFRIRPDPEKVKVGSSDFKREVFYANAGD